jgi:DNA-binding GntR family transcriptional regulator
MYRTMEEYAYHAIKEAIFSGAFPPDSKILIDEAAERLKLSKTPVREALRRLAHDGFVTLLPHMGAVVSSLDVEKVVEVYRIREALEVLAMTEAAKMVTPEDITRLKGLLEQMETATLHEDWSALLKLNRNFHRAVSELAKMPLLAKMLDELRDQSERYRRAETSDVHRMQHAFEEHKQIVTMLEAQDIEGLDQMVRSHLRATAETLARKWRTMNTTGKSD